MQLQILREEPVNSGLFAPTGDVVPAGVEWTEHLAYLTHREGTRFAVYPYDTMARSVPPRSPEEQLAPAEPEEAAEVSAGEDEPQT